MTRIYIDKATGKKLYPVCGFQRSQHKIFNAHDRAFTWVYDTEYRDERALAELERVEKAMEWVHCIYDGLIYAPYDVYLIMKDIIAAYDARH